MYSSNIYDRELELFPVTDVIFRHSQMLLIMMLNCQAYRKDLILMFNKRAIATLPFCQKQLMCLLLIMILLESDDDCNTIFGCYGAIAEDGEYERCSCYRDCHHSGPKVCASDGEIHPNLCRLEVEACRRGSHIIVKPMSFCNQGERWMSPIKSPLSFIPFLLRLCGTYVGTKEATRTISLAMAQR